MGSETISPGGEGLPRWGVELSHPVVKDSPIGEWDDLARRERLPRWGV